MNIEKKQIAGRIESDALKANLLETAGSVVIDEELLILLEVVEKFKGLHSTLEKLLYEVCHPFRNWRLILPQLRSFVLKNSKYYTEHENGPEALRLFGGLFFDAIQDTQRDSILLSQAIGGMLVWLDKVIGGSTVASLYRLGPQLNQIFLRLAAFDDDDGPVIMQIVHGQQPVARIAKRLVAVTEDDGNNYDYLPLVELVQTVFRRCYGYWLKEDDPLDWFLTRCAIPEKKSRFSRLFSPISHLTMEKHLGVLNSLELEGDGLGQLKLLLELPAHVDIVKYYRAIPGKLAVEEEELQRREQGAGGMYFFNENRKLLFLFKIMDTRGLYLIHEETLREINRSLVQLIRQQSFEEIEEFLLTTFKLLKANIRKFPHTSLQCIQVLGGEVFDRGNSRMVEAFLWEVVRFGFQHANVVGVDENWQPLSNPAHLANIRVWLHLIMREPKWCSTLFSALIIHLRLTGTCVKDTDLFQRDITELLNHPIEPIYNLAKQFTKLMPVFFNEIGSEGELRDVSTELDEIHRRKDGLIHFLRKQGHVESSNLIVDFIQAIFLFWKSKDRVLLSSYLPEEVYCQVKTGGKYVDEQYVLSERFWREMEIAKVQDILLIGEAAIAEFLQRQKDLDSNEVRRFELLVRMYKLLHKKYNLGFQQLRSELNRAVNDGFPEIGQLLSEKLDLGDTRQCLEVLLNTLEGLKETILSEEKFEAREDIYYKRHIAVDIPSVYGRYKEKKFDALSLTFRLENLANIYLERLPQTVNLSIITQATFYNIVRCIKIYMKALAIDGITSRRLSTSLSLLKNSLKVPRFSYTQYLDIVRGMSEGVKDIIYASYTNIHQNNLSIIIPQIDRDNLLPKYQNLYESDETTSTVQKLSEMFFREMISSTFGLQHLDNFILRILQTLENQKDILDERKLNLLMTYNPDRALSLLKGLNPFTNDLIHLGNKGFNLATLTGEGKPVPPAFVITTEIFRCREVVLGYSQTREEFMKRIRNSLNEIEKQTGKIFGSPDAPLLLSVRSGGAISMPGMMATVHNIGFNEELIEESISRNGMKYFSWDNYRRFLQSWAMISGMGREDFQILMDDAKKRHNVSLKREFSPEQMKELALSYQRLIRQKGIGIPDDPWLQLVNAIELVLDSWKTYKAMEYRRIMDVSDSWGTAVIVQAMVFGNQSENAGSGVVFTAHPYRKVQRVALWGDYAYGDQGEDIVSGLVTSCAISVEQAELDGRSVDETLEKMFPAIYRALLEVSRELVYDKRWNPQEIEFTFEGPEPEDLYLLQTRDMITIKKKEHLNVFVQTPEIETAHLGKGVGVSGSALSGRAVFTEEDIKHLRESDPDSPIILIRQDTVPEDIKAVSLADGLLTSRGGQTSHASVVAVRLGKTCVVGCGSLKVYEAEQYCEIAGVKIGFGDPVSIDGRNGQFLNGMHPVLEEYHILPI